MNTRRNGCLLALVVGLMVTPTHLPSCGPMFEEAVFSYESYPVTFEKGYLEGRLGVIRPTFWRKFLLAAYRHMNEKPLTAVERSGYAPAEAVDGTKRWVEAREKATGKKNSKQWMATERRHGDFQSYFNCGTDALVTAATTLEDRVRRFGAQSPGVQAWISAQDAVFSNCGAGARIPAQPDSALEPILAADRRYQIAAAHFYAEGFDEARRRFQQIGKETNSPWRALGPYLAARCLLRKATLLAPEETFDRPLMQQAHDELAAMEHPPAKRLLGYTVVRLQPEQTLARLAAALVDPGQSADFQQNLLDFQFLMDRKEATDDVTRKAGDLPHWIRVFQSAAPDSLREAVEEWKRRQADHWLVAVMSKTNARHPDVRQFLDAAGQVKPASPAYATLTYHRFRLLIELGEQDAARKEIDALLAAPPASVNLSTVNLLKQQRLTLARDFEEFLTYSPRTPIGAYFYDEWDARTVESGEGRIDADSAVVFNNGLPLSMLRRAAESEKLSPSLRQDLLLANWTRAVILGDDRLAREFAPALARQYPEVKQYAEAVRTAASAEDRRFQAANLMLHFTHSRPFVQPGIQPKSEGDYSYRWWCVAENEESPAPPAFLSPDERTQFEEQFQRMKARENAPTFMGKIVIDWVRRHPESELGPEALHYAVRATRIGCHHTTDRAVSRGAFQLLHKLWPKSEWAKKTPYYY